jgi:hypothetical protein
MKHPFERKVFFTTQSENFLSLNEIKRKILVGELSSCDLVFDVDGSSYTAGSIVQGEAPKWAMTAEHDPMLHDCPPLSAENAAMVNELVSEDDFLEMPQVPDTKSVKDFLSRDPRIARLVADSERLFVPIGTSVE